MIDRPILSIIIPVYGVERYLEACVASVTEQWQEGTEILLIDDGSPDASPEICDRLAEQYPYIHTYHKENGGLSSARNFGIEKASGTYLLFLDSDDSLLPGSLKPIFSACRKANADVIVGSYVKKDADTGLLSEDYRLDTAQICSRTGEALLGYLFSLHEYCFYAWLYIVRRDYLLEHRFFFCPEHEYEDLLWTPGVLYSAKAAEAIPDPFYSYLYKRKDSISTSFSVKSYYDKLYGCRAVTRFLSEHPVSRETDRTVKGKLNYIYSSLLSEAWLLNREERKKIRPELRQYREILKFSDRRIHRLFYPLTCVFGLSGVGYILHLRWKLSQKKRSRG